MKWSRINKLSEEEFRRLTGVKRGTFDAMAKVMSESRAAKKESSGWSSK